MFNTFVLIVWRIARFTGGYIVYSLAVQIIAKLD